MIIRYCDILYIDIEIRLMWQ